MSWLICNYLADGCGGAPSVIRECQTPGCGVQVWVSSAILPLVESGELHPRCWACHTQFGEAKDLRMHPAQLAELRRLDMVERGFEVLGAMNDELDDIRRGTYQ